MQQWNTIMNINTANILYMFFLALGSTIPGASFASDPVDTHTADVIDISDVEVQFKVKVLGIARIRGSFDRLQGSMISNEHGGPYTVNMRIEVGSINTRDNERDMYLRGPAFFEVDRYPHILFKGNCMQQPADGHMSLTGELQLRGHSRQVVFDIEPMQTAGGIQSYRAKTIIKRSDFGLISLKNIVSDQIEIIVVM